MLDKNDLIERIKYVGNNTDANFDAVAVGGTSLILHGLKQQTRDVDFIIERGDMEKFASKYKEKYGEIIHLALPCTCFALYMPADYFSQTTNFGTYGHVNLHALSIDDTIITKATRLNDRDRNDLNMCRYIDADNIIKRLADFELKTEHHKNVKNALQEIWNVII